MTEGATAGASRDNRSEGADEEHPVGIAARWGLSSLDWHAHAIDEKADHPSGVYLARCGHRLGKANTLYDDPPSRICPSCARWTER